jgi:hypothetical protein
VSLQKKRNSASSLRPRSAARKPQTRTRKDNADHASPSSFSTKSKSNAPRCAPLPEGKELFTGETGFILFRAIQRKRSRRSAWQRRRRCVGFSPPSFSCQHAFFRFLENSTMRAASPTRKPGRRRVAPHWRHKTRQKRVKSNDLHVPLIHRKEPPQNSRER